MDYNREIKISANYVNMSIQWQAYDNIQFNYYLRILTYTHAFKEIGCDAWKQQYLLKTIDRIIVDIV